MYSVDLRIQGLMLDLGGGLLYIFGAGCLKFLSYDHLIFLVTLFFIGLIVNE